MAAAPSLLKLGDEFLTWAEFKAALDNYQETTHAELSKISSKKVETENRKLPEGVQKFPCAHVYRAVKFGCIHYGKPRPSGSGIRPNQSTFKMGCPAEIYVSSDRKKGKLVVTSFNDNHNHEVGEEVRKYYPSQRRLEGELLEEACKLTKLRVDVRVLKDHVHKTSGKLTTSKDLHNLRASLQQGTEADAVIRALEDILHNDKGAKIAVVLDQDQTLEALYLQTSAMVSSFSSFPEILFMDATYKTNNLNIDVT
ncbi:PREDICTED: uncharacterized protein LOC109486916 [Branchiostoma belcheri]|uniref:Uncharacterized protein LOC109486916 n=1 Tax=Branchiostoma belcheri TaxID=7741 RepID=A0A6P5AWL7_BRABE|nr:PREDICTED: uncharacterized protein LOC109486916 [Branchiostoma belcheri]